LAIFSFFKQNLDQNIPKNAYFWKKRLKSSQRRGLRPRILLA